MIKIKWVILISIILGLLIFSNRLEAQKTGKIKIENNTIYMNSLTLRQKIAQMFIIKGDKRNLALTELDAGGIGLGNLHTEKDYQIRIEQYQEKSSIKLFIAADLEGYWNPFPFAKFPYVDEIETKEEAYELGKEHGKILKKLGFNINFAPVAEIEDRVWRHRAFKGNSSEIADKVNSYIGGIQEEGMIATVKHYPGGSLNKKDPHKHVVKSEISEEQLEVFNSALPKADAVMVGHAIVYGAADSKGKPSSVSEDIIQDLRKKFAGLIISDDISMRGLRNKYFLRERQLFIDLVKAGNDIIIDSSWSLFPKYNFNKKMGYIEEAVKSGQIKEEQIDESVKRILRAKGYNAV